MKSKGFALIELVIVMVILAILVTLGVPKFLGQSDKAQKTKLISDGRVLEDAINRYYIDHGDWPRLTPEDQPLTDAELTSKIYALNDKGFDAPFAPEEGAKYYDVNLESLKPYIKSFNSDIKHFVLQNPVGSVYIQDPAENARLSGSTEAPGKEDPELGKPVAVISIQPEGLIFTGDRVTYSHENSIIPSGTTVVDVEWEGGEPSFSTAGEYNIRLRIKSSDGVWSSWAESKLTVMPKYSETSMRISTNTFSTIVLAENGMVYSFGSNNRGQLGIGNTIDQTSPQIITGLTDKSIIEVVSGGQHSLALSKDGTVYSFGLNNYGQLGLGNNTNYSTPQIVTSLSSKNIKKIAAGTNHSLALSSDGTVYSFGYNHVGQLGLGNANSYNTPQALTVLNGKGIVDIFSRSDHAMALSSDGEVYAFGSNNSGELGLGHTAIQNTPTIITALTGKGIEKIVAGSSYTIALSKSGDVYVFGSNSYGRLGIESVSIASTPILLSSLSHEKIVDIAAGSGTSICLSSNGTVYSFGGNGYGQLGHGDSVSLSTPKIVNALDGKKIIKVASGSSHTIALSDDGSVYTSGYGASLGLGSTSNKTVHTIIPSFKLK